MIKFSVILTTYNSEKWIKRTVDSIQNQIGAGISFDLELIVVDDHSDDQTVKILKDLNVIVIENVQNSGGPNKGRNIGLKSCTGDYICIADHDDEWLPEKLSVLLPSLDLAPILTSSYILYDHEKNRTTTIGCTNEEIHIYSQNETFVSRLSKSKNGQNCYLGSIVFHSGLKSIFFEEEIGSMDFDWLLRLLHGQISAEVCRPLYKRHVYKYNLSLSEKYRNKDLEFSISCLDSYYKEYPLEVKKGKKRLYGTMGRYYFLTDDLVKARFYFLKSGFSMKSVLYIFTSYCCAGFVRKKFKIFG